MCGRPTTAVPAMAATSSQVIGDAEVDQPIDHGPGRAAPGRRGCAGFPRRAPGRRGRTGRPAGAGCGPSSRHDSSMPGTRVRRSGSALTGLRVPGHRVVVGQRHHVQAGLRGAAHHLGRGVGAVRSVAVHMQVGAHLRQGGRLAGWRRRERPEGQIEDPWPGSRRSRSPIGSISRMPAVSGQRTTHSQWPLISPANTARSGESTLPQREVMVAERRPCATGGAGREARSRGPGRPARPAPRPGRAPGSSATTSMSAGPAHRVRAGQRDRAGADAGPLVARPGEARDQPAHRQRPGQPDRDARGAEQPVQAFPGRAERGQQGVNLAMPVTAPGAGPGGRLADGLAAPRAGGWRMTVAIWAHAHPIARGRCGYGRVLTRSRADHSG